MPSTYAHFRFGQQVYHRLPEKLRSQIQPYKNLFDIGLHGPDLLFYYRPLISNRINRIGYAMHNKSGYAVFPISVKLPINPNDQKHILLIFTAFYAILH